MGALAVVITLRFREGLWGAVARRYDVRFFPVQRRLHLRSGAEK